MRRASSAKCSRIGQEMGESSFHLPIQFIRSLHQVLARSQGVKGRTSQRRKGDEKQRKTERVKLTTRPDDKFTTRPLYVVQSIRTELLA